MPLNEFVDIKQGDVYFVSAGDERLEVRIVNCDKENNLFAAYRYERDEFEETIESSKKLSLFYITPDLKEFREVDFCYFNKDSGYGFTRPGEA